MTDTEGVRPEFDDCDQSPTGKHSASWFSNDNCEYCNTGEVSAPLYYASTPQAQEHVATVQCVRGVTIGYLEKMLPVGTKLYTAQPEPTDFDMWCREQFEYKNWYYRERGSGDMAVLFARKAWNAGLTKGALAAPQPPQAQQPLSEEQIDVLAMDEEGLPNSQRKAAHPAVKPDMLINAGALRMDLNALRRAGKDEVADELEKTAAPAQQPLSDEQILSYWSGCDGQRMLRTVLGRNKVLAFGRQIEAHGIGE